jgi:hypothetical protein
MKHLIRKILKEEVNKKYPKPTPNIEKLIYDWLDNYFEGSKTYEKVIWDSRYDFEWCNRGKVIMQVLLRFDNDDDVWDDQRKIEERDFESGTLWVPKDIVNDLATDIPVRRTYLRYVIEEWFEDTYLGEIQNKMKRNNISIDEFQEFPERADVCVPPMTKPEDVTQEEMIELILKTTLFKRDHLLRQEQETPGYIEKIYLQKLHQKEYERLKGQ